MTRDSTTSPFFQPALPGNPTEMDNTRPGWRPVLSLCALLALLLMAMILWPPASHVFEGLHRYPPLHTLLETFAVVVAAIIFGFGWNAYGDSRSGNNVLLACAFLAVAILDTAHFLSYPGMPDFITPSGTEKAIDFWLAARLTSVAALLLIVLRPWQASISPGQARLWLGITLLYTAGLLWLVFFHADWLPRTFIPGSGLTMFKIGTEWLVIALAALVAWRVWQQRQQAALPYDAASLFAAAVIMALSELCFTLYGHATDVFNLLGHIYKVIAYAYIYRAVFVVAVRQPYARLSESEERFRKMIEASPDAIVSVDENLRIAGVNSSAEALYGYSARELLGQPLDKLLPEQVRGRHDADAQGYFSTERRSRYMGLNRIVAGRHKDGRELLLDIGLMKIEVQGKTYAISLARDVTRQQQAEAEIRRLNAELENRVRQRTLQLEIANRELEAFCYSVSHDLRAPLRGIDGFARALGEDYGKQLDETAQDYLQRVCNGTQRMSQLIDDLLQLSRISRAEFNPSEVDLSMLAREILHELGKTSPHRQVELHITPELKAPGDPRLLHIALTNLLSNAWKFTGKTPVARIVMGREHNRDEQVFFVRDNGAGFDMAHAGKLFGAFQRLHQVAEFEGTGIGLATVQRIIQRHGGRIWADAAPDQGATFYFTLTGDCRPGFGH